jgi:hypothetical protein
MLVLAHRFKRIAEPFFNISQQVMEFGFVIVREQIVRALPGALVIADVGVGARQIERVCVVVRL